jgi:hypothetical protein
VVRKTTMKPSRDGPNVDGSRVRPTHIHMSCVDANSADAMGKGLHPETLADLWQSKNVTKTFLIKY